MAEQLVLMDAPRVDSNPEVDVIRRAEAARRSDRVGRATRPVRAEDAGWRLDERTRAVGRKGLSAARTALERAARGTAA